MLCCGLRILGSPCLTHRVEWIGFNGFSATNTSIEDFFFDRFSGVKVSPKLAKTNSLRHHMACALFYSAKSTPDDAAIITALGLDAMRKLVGYVHQPLKQGGPHDKDAVANSPWRLSLMNWGHDPMKW